MSNEKIAQAIQEAIEEQTFTKDALARFNVLIDQVEELEQENRALDLSLTNKTAALETAQGAAADLQSQLETYKTQEEELAKREAKMVALERNEAVANARSETWKEAAGLMFRNTEIRRSSYENRQTPAGADGYGTNNLVNSAGETEVAE